MKSIFDKTDIYNENTSDKGVILNKEEDNVHIQRLDHILNLLDILEEKTPGEGAILNEETM